MQAPQLCRMVPPLRPLHFVSASRLLHAPCRRSRPASSAPQMRCGHLGYHTRAPVPQPSCCLVPKMSDALRAAQAKHNDKGDPAAPSALPASSPRGGPGAAATMADASGGRGGAEGGRGRAGSEGPAPEGNKGVSPVVGKRHAACDAHELEAGKASRGAGTTQKRLHDPHTHLVVCAPNRQPGFWHCCMPGMFDLHQDLRLARRWQGAGAGGGGGPAVV